MLAIKRLIYRKQTTLFRASQAFNPLLLYNFKEMRLSKNMLDNLILCDIFYVRKFLD